MQNRYFFIPSFSGKAPENIFAIFLQDTQLPGWFTGLPYGINRLSVNLSHVTDRQTGGKGISLAEHLLRNAQLKTGHMDATHFQQVKNECYATCSKEVTEKINRS